MKKIFIVVGTRPNFIKITQFKKEAKKFPTLDIKIIHTGQHFDANMSEIFFTQFELEPDIYLNAEKGRPAAQIASIIQKLDDLVNEDRPDLILVPGDVNSTLATAIVANKNNIALGHIESGLRSFDQEMPEEHNRILTDQISQFCFVTEPSGMHNLAQENSLAAVHYVGNTMIDTLVAFQKQIDDCKFFEKLKLTQGNYFLLTMHRPSNVDNDEGLIFLHQLLKDLSKSRDIVFPAHPRTLKNLDALNLLQEIRENKKVHFIEPLGYFEFQNLVKNAFCCITDSGGIQEETTFVSIPCLTLRPNTERPITITKGTNTLLPNDIGMVNKYIKAIEQGEYKQGDIPENWDGSATFRILEVISNIK